MTSTSSAVFSYLMVVPGVIAALTLGRLLGGGALLLRRPDIRPYFIHVGWAILLFLLQIQFWHASSQWSEVTKIGQDVLHYCVYLIFPVTMYLASAILVPTEAPEPNFDYRQYYYDHATVFFSICCASMLSVIII